jgi:hypothetical protein
VNREAQFKTLKYRPDFPIKVLQPTFTPALLNGNPKSFKDLEALPKQLGAKVGKTGPSRMWPRIKELEQHLLDATCRKLHRFWHESATGETPG